MVKTDYLGVHETKYKRLKEEGASGWNSLVLSQDSVQKITATLAEQGIASGTLLELDCGAGNLSLKLAAKRYQVHGIDISPTAITWAKERKQNENLPLPHQNECIFRADMSINNLLNRTDVKRLF
ncbi:MAG: methyltransferase domain-containing protein [bacterium]|nr:methyltransferase domain-containing protein [bacterium]